MSKCLATSGQSAINPFSCLPIRELVEVHQKSDKTTQGAAQNKLWVPVLQYLNPARCTQVAENAEVEARKAAHSWKSRLNEMLSATKNKALLIQIKDQPFFDKLQTVAPRLDQMLKGFCQTYETLEFIPQFFTEKAFTPSFFEHLFTHFEDRRYLFLFLHFIRTGKDCSYLWTLCAKRPKQFDDKEKRVFENQTLELLFYLGIRSGISIDQFVKAGFPVNYVDASGCSFLHYYLLKFAKSYSQSSEAKESKDRLALACRPVPISEESYLEQFEALCAQSGSVINTVYNGKTALDIALENHYEKEATILKKHMEEFEFVEPYKEADPFQFEAVDVEDFVIFDVVNPEGS